jgi:hypothetical protein
MRLVPLLDVQKFSLTRAHQLLSKSLRQKEIKKKKMNKKKARKKKRKRLKRKKSYQHLELFGPNQTQHYQPFNRKQKRILQLQLMIHNHLCFRRFLLINTDTVRPKCHMNTIYFNNYQKM